MKKIISLAFIKSLPVMAGYLVLGFGFGILLQEAHYGVIWALCMGVFIYAGAMQYVAVGLLSSSASLITAALTTLMVNARHLFYGITMAEHYKGSGRFKPYLMFGLTDETYALVCSGKAPENVDFHKYSFFLTLFNHCYWITGGAIGVIAGTMLPINFAGVDFVMTALFITVFIDQWRSNKEHFSALAGVISSVVCLVFFGADSFLIPSMIFICILLCAGRGIIEGKKAKCEEEGEKQ